MNEGGGSKSSIGIIGAGIQGICISLCLIKKGFKVTLIDHDDPGKDSASYGNAGHFSTPHLKGDTAIIEYYQPAETKGILSLVIKEIIHDYRDIMDFSGNGRDWECGVNIICETEIQ